MSDTGPDLSPPSDAGTAQYGSSAWDVDPSTKGSPVPVSRQPAYRGYGGWAGTTNQPMGSTIKQETEEQLLQGFFQMTPEQRSTVQVQLLLTGYDNRDPKKVKFGQNDPTSYRAYANAVQKAGISGKPLEELLAEGGDATAENLSALARAGAGVHTNIIQHTSDADLKTNMVKGFQSALGRAPTPQEAAAFAQAFRGQETAAQPDTSGGGTFNVTDPGNPANAAEEFARQENPSLAAGNDRLQAFGAMLQALNFTGTKLA